MSIKFKGGSGNTCNGNANGNGGGSAHWGVTSISEILLENLHSLVEIVRICKSNTTPGSDAGSGFDSGSECLCSIFWTL